MDIKEIKETLIAYRAGEVQLNEVEKMALRDTLDAYALTAARLIDILEAIDPYKQSKNSPALGTANKRSTTYKVRKALGYSYP